MDNIPKISEAEWEVMKIIWSTELCTANKVIEVLEDNKVWKPKTVKTLISRLVKKGALGFKIEGRTYYYYPLVSEEKCVKEESKSFINRFYNGAIKNMLLNFIEDNELTEKDLDDLKRILDDRK